MKKLSGRETRQTYLDFFVRHGHTLVPSSSLVPGNDPTLLFTNAGMVQFKDTFTGLERRPYTRATTSQKVLRVSGKHNDLEEVGPSNRHQTFFEMLGNFSFGDYFKAEAIRLAWKLLLEEFELPLERLWFTVFAGNGSIPADEEAERLWIETGAAPDRVLRFGEKDNFWVMGDTGPCGPCSEITMYIGDDLSKMGPHGVNGDDPDYVEIWNLVFMQFDRATMKPLPSPSVDTGMGLERICLCLQGVHATYDTDLFTPIIERTIELAGANAQHYHQHLAAYRAVADHTRACTFLISDGILPGNEGRSYVLRRILRRAAYQGRTIGLVKPFLAETAAVVIDEMGDAYPDLRKRRDFILQTITAEEERFGRTITTGLGLIERELSGLRHGDHLPGRAAFTLHDTYGFPLDLTEKISAERGISVDLEGYAAARKEQQEQSRAGAQFKKGTGAALWTDQNLPATEFTGYATTQDHSNILSLVVDGEVAQAAGQGQQVQVVLEHTPFYAESGGQVGDTGFLIGSDGLIRVTDTQRPITGLIVHQGEVEHGIVSVGEGVDARVDADRRADIVRNHTATHLLHRALRDVLGDHAAQAGSLVAPDRLRFDFTHMSAVTPDQLHDVEARINAWVRADTPVEWEVTDYQNAIHRGAMALFGEKYGDRVRMVTVGCPGGVAVASSTPGQQCSRELCGGVHVGRTGEIGLFRIVGESSVASGVRRIEALTGRGADSWVAGQTATLREVATRLGVPPAQVLERVESLLAELKQRQHELDTLQAQNARGSLEGLLGQTQQENGVTYIAARVAAPDATRLREMGDWLRDKLGSGIVVLGAVINDKPQFVAMVKGEPLAQGYHAGKLVTALAGIVGGKGGGRPDMAQGGGTNVAQLDQAIQQVGILLADQGTSAKK